jgi:hypothetical protein
MQFLLSPINLLMPSVRYVGVDVTRARTLLTSYCLLFDLLFQTVFNSVPFPAAGNVRMSFLNMKQAGQFQDRIDRILSPTSPWKAGNPRIHVWEEWSGIWDDAGVSQSVHENNIRYLKTRQTVEGKIRTVSNLRAARSVVYCSILRWTHTCNLHCCMPKLYTLSPTLRRC